MKIEPKHNSKLPSYAVVGAAFVAAAMLTGCPAMQVEGDVQMTIPTTTDEIQMSGELTECEDCYDDSYEDPTQVPTLPQRNSIADYADINSKQYMWLMDIADTVEYENPGKFRFSISAVMDYDLSTDLENPKYFFVLVAHSEDETQYYAVYEDEQVRLDEKPGMLFFDPENAYSYEEIRRLPFLISTDYLRHTEVTVNGPVRFTHTPVVLYVEDGRYAGEIIGISSDGTRALFKIGKPVVLEYFQVKRLSEGEEIGYKDFVRGPVDEDGDSYVLPVPVQSPSSETDVKFQLDRYDDHSGRTYDGILMCELTYWYEDTVIVELPIADDCKVFSRFEAYDHPDEMPDDWKENGARMTDTFFFKDSTANDTRMPDDNGWYMTYGSIDTMYITDGVVTEIEMSLYDHPLVGI